LQQPIDLLKDGLGETNWLLRDLVSREIYDGPQMDALQDLYNGIVWQIAALKEAKETLLAEYYPPE
jgi:hypothetical protein